MESRGPRWLGVSCVSRRRRRLGILSVVTLTGLLACAASSRASLAASGSEPSAADVEARRGKDRLDREETADADAANDDDDDNDEQEQDKQGAGGGDADDDVQAAIALGESAVTPAPPSRSRAWTT